MHIKCNLLIKIIQSVKRMLALVHIPIFAASPISLRNIPVTELSYSQQSSFTFFRPALPFSSLCFQAQSFVLQERFSLFFFFGQSIFSIAIHSYFLAVLSIPQTGDWNGCTTSSSPPPPFFVKLKTFLRSWGQLFMGNRGRAFSTSHRHPQIAMTVCPAWEASEQGFCIRSISQRSLLVSL